MEEKMAILKMLEDGKITPEQAAELIKAVSSSAEASAGTHSNSQQQHTQPHHTPHAYHTHHTSHTYHTPPSPADDVPRQNYSGARPPGDSTSKGLGLDEIAADLRDKAVELAKEWEPKVRTIAGVVAEKTADLADRVAKAAETRTTSHSSGFTESLRSAVPHGTTAHTPSSATLDSTFELAVHGASNELILSGLNGPVTVKGYNGDKISAKISYRPKRLGADIALVSHGNKYILIYDDTAFHAIAIDAYVPDKLFRTVRVSADNAPLHISGVSTASFSAELTNVTATITGINAESFGVNGVGGRLEVVDITAKSGNIETTNTAVSAINLDIENMRLETSNAPINLSISNYVKFREYSWLVETSNGRIFASIPSTPDLGYYLKAASALGSVKLGITGLSYTQNTASSVEARSINYDTCAKHVRISFESSNADIIVN
ncbi:MAG: DUF4097 domain-containing protein [Defluviitaleaceae bacterium]|nr:DUF4097 domain-containing protein [Defluviitaleaceae bacterium]